MFLRVFKLLSRTVMPVGNFTPLVLIVDLLKDGLRHLRAFLEPNYGL